MKSTIHDARRRAEAGVTLIEMLIVLVIIGLIAGLVGPQLFSQVDRSRSIAAEAEIRALKNALDTLRLDIGRYPTTEEGLTLLIEPPPDNAVNWFGPYLEQDDPPVDPWQSPYVYERDTEDERIIYLYTLGADGRVGGNGADADIGDLPGTVSS
ncbi:MAG: type II secretion system major pseudopilin GspG [Maricaulaceae bacterium]